MGVVNGQAVDADTFNDEFASINVDNIYAGKQAISNPTESTNPDTGSITTLGGAGIKKNLNVGGNAVVVGTVAGSNLSGTNTGNVSVTSVGSTPSPNGVTLSGQALTLQPANATNPGLVTTLTQSFDGIKTFIGKVFFQGGIEVSGTATILHTTELQVDDANVLLNKGGTNASAEDAGIEIERVTGGNGAAHFDSTLGSKWKVGIIGAMFEVIVAAGTQTIGGLKTFSSKLTTSDILIDGILFQGVQTNTQSGSNITLTNPTKPVVVVTNASLVSIQTIAAPAANSQGFVLINKTGVSITIKDASGISTGTGADLVFASGKSLQVIYDTNGTASWRIVGGTGSGGGSKVFGTLGAPRVVVAATGITVAASHMDAAADNQIIFIEGSITGESDISALNPAIQAGTIVGQTLRLRGVNSDKYVALDGDPTKGIITRGRLMITDQASYVFWWNGSQWEQQ